MTTPSSGPISAQHINTELGNPTTQQLGLNDSAVRTLAGVSSGTIAYNDLRGKSSFSASGGTVTTPGNGYTYHTFTSPGTFVLSGTKNFDVLVVAGGGGGGPSYDSNGGGGGAGGLIYVPSMSISTGNYSVTIGAGASQWNTNTGQTGGDSQLGSLLTAKGGGYGGGGPRGAQYPGGPGGSGGGGSGFSGDTPAGSATQPSQPGNSGTYGYGHAGQHTTGSRGDGGGGAGGMGTTPGPNHYNGNGGAGRQYPGFTGPLIGVPALAPLSGYFAGGGGSGYGGVGGSGGGSPGSPLGPPVSAPGKPRPNGTANSGGGGGGTWAYGFGGDGGSGIVVIRYAV
tara:strand:- start:969 stop:1985 length:1017 start_codon:yes stop_codon:yes gene_type:complete